MQFKSHDTSTMPKSQRNHSGGVKFTKDKREVPLMLHTSSRNVVFMKSPQQGADRSDGTTRLYEKQVWTFLKVLSLPKELQVTNGFYQKKSLYMFNS